MDCLVSHHLLCSVIDPGSPEYRLCRSLGAIVMLIQRLSFRPLLAVPEPNHRHHAPFRPSTSRPFSARSVFPVPTKPIDTVGIPSRSIQRAENSTWFIEQTSDSRYDAFGLYAQS